MPTDSERCTHPDLKSAFFFWLKLGCISFGGPSGQIALMHAELVEKRHWISEQRFLHALNYCMLLPGPEAQQLATYIGWLWFKIPGGIIAGTLFVLPAALLLWGLSFCYVTYGQLAPVAACFNGLKSAVLALLVGALIKLAPRALKSTVTWLIAVAAFICHTFLHISLPLILIGAALIGLWRHLIFKTATPKNLNAPTESWLPRALVLQSLRTALVALGLWWLPIIGFGLWLGWEHIVYRQGLFFSQAATVTFGGAYSVLPYVSQQAVSHYGWLSPHQMIDGLALAETTPGPLIIVLQFVGFIGGWQNAAPFSPLLTATLCSLITLWATFMPSFAWIFTGAPIIEHLRERPALDALMSAISASVLGIMLSFTLNFSVIIASPDGLSHSLFRYALALAALVALSRLKWSSALVIGLCALFGLLEWMMV